MWRQRHERAANPGSRARRQAAPDSSSQGVDADVEVDEEAGTVTRLEESGVSPGAGEAEVVKVTAPVQREGDQVTAHPTLRDGEKADVEHR